MIIRTEELIKIFKQRANKNPNAKYIIDLRPEKIQLYIVGFMKERRFFFYFNFNNTSYVKYTIKDCYKVNRNNNIHYISRMQYLYVLGTALESVGIHSLYALNLVVKKYIKEIEISELENFKYV